MNTLWKVMVLVASCWLLVIMGYVLAMVLHCFVNGEGGGKNDILQNLTQAMRLGAYLLEHKSSLVAIYRLQQLCFEIPKPASSAMVMIPLRLGVVMTCMSSRCCDDIFLLHYTNSIVKDPSSFYSLTYHFALILSANPSPPLVELFTH